MAGMRSCSAIASISWAPRPHIATQSSNESMELLRSWSEVTDDRNLRLGAAGPGERDRPRADPVVDRGGMSAGSRNRLARHSKARMLGRYLSVADACRNLVRYFRTAARNLRRLSRACRESVSATYPPRPAAT